jgi:hypothetical protein
MFFRSKKSLFDFAPEGYLTPSGWALKLDSKKSEVAAEVLALRRRKVIFHKALRAELDTRKAEAAR